MFILMPQFKPALKLFVTILSAFLLGACSIASPAPTATKAPSPTPFIPSNTPSPNPTTTPSPAITVFPTCTPLPVTYIFVIDEAVYNDVDAGIDLGAKGAIEVLQQALDDYHPEWGQQEGLARYVRNHSAAQMIGVNPRVFLVTAGEALDWRIPNGHDVRDVIVQVGVTLTQHYRDFRFTEGLQNDYPQVANAASYALYAFFDFDLEKLDTWQQEYDQMFGEIQPRITAEGCQPTIPTPTPDFCSATQWQGKIQVLSNDLLVALRPGGPTVFDRVLAEQNPAWADFRQSQNGEIRSAGVIFHETAFGPELGTGVNPAVLLVTYGVQRNWELPANGDLVSEVDHIRAELHQYESDVILGNVDQSQYPVANTATYALYRYFNGDISKLENWCHTYVRIYGESPLK